MLLGIRRRLSYANVAATLALAAAIGGGTAVALSGNAETVNGVHVNKINFVATGDRTDRILSAGALTLRATCTGGVLSLKAITDRNNAEIQSYGYEADTNSDDFDKADNPLEIFAGGSNGAQFDQRDMVYKPPHGRTVSLQYFASDNAPLGGTAECLVSGFADSK